MGSKYLSPIGKVAKSAVSLYNRDFILNKRKPRSWGLPWPPSLPEINDESMREKLFIHRSTPHSPQKLLESHKFTVLGDRYIRFSTVRELFRRYPNMESNEIQDSASILSNSDCLKLCAKMYDFPRVFHASELLVRSPSALADLTRSYVGGLYYTDEESLCQWYPQTLDPIFSMMDHCIEWGVSDDILDERTHTRLMEDVSSRKHKTD